MNASLLTVIGSALALAIMILKLFTDKDKEEKKKIDDAGKLIGEGIRDGDVSKITAGFTRLRNL